MSTGTVLLIIGGICIVAWIYAEVRRARRMIKRGRSKKPAPNARRAGDVDDSGKARRGIKDTDFIQYEAPNK